MTDRPQEALRSRLGSETSLGVGLAVVSVLILYLRIPSAPFKLWAEDGSVFLQAAIDHGPLAPLADTYAGYFHTLPRFIAGVASLFPIRSAATVTWVLVAAVAAWTVFTVFTEARPWLQSVVGRALLALTLVLHPITSSVANAANLQFSLVFASAAVLAGSPTGWRRRSAAALLAITALSTALSIVLVPVVIWRVARQRRVDLFVAIWLVATGAQFLGMLVSGAGRPFGLSASFPFSSRVVPYAVFAFVLLLLLIAAAVWFAISRADWDWCGFAGVILLVGLLELSLTAVSNSGLIVPRYAIVPILCVLWVALSAAEYVRPALGRMSSAVFPVLVVVVAGLLIIGWPPSPLRTDGPSWREGLASGSAECSGVAVVKILPASAEWDVRVPCSRIH